SAGFHGISNQSTDDNNVPCRAIRVFLRKNVKITIKVTIVWKLRLPLNR
ncbi:MAG: hypothetical protein ACI808_002049, partial [Paraglaciecola sp.]